MNAELHKLTTQLEAIQARHAEEVVEIKDQIETLRQGELDKIIEQGQALGFNLRLAGSNSSPGRKSTKTRTMTCKACKEAGVTSEGHNSRGHGKWLSRQPEDLQAKFK